MKPFIRLALASALAASTFSSAFASDPETLRVTYVTAPFNVPSIVEKHEGILEADFGAKAPPEMMVGFWRAVSRVAHELGLDPEGYRIVANHGPNGGQLVFHFHVHIFGGRTMSHAMGSMPSQDNAG